jgi:quercetin dioxygenase-like cupin family protein
MTDVHVQSLTDLAKYQDGAIVSTILLKKDRGSVTLFAFDKGQDLSEHTVPHDALVHVLDGEVEITVAGTAHRLEGGEIIVMPANRPHSVKAVERSRMVLTMIRS